MCGIGGLVGLDFDDSIMDQMIKTMQLRGPDDTGRFSCRDCAMLHSRLAIIDPEGGRQPMQLQWEGEYYTIVYNGELYNTKEVKTELVLLGHRFVSHCDTEVVLHAYAQWGGKSLEKFNGIFAFAVWEHKNKRLFLARDRIGVKPLFYKLHEKGLIFSSEIKTILAYPSVVAELDAEGIAQILMIGPGRIPGSGVFRGIMELEPGCCGIFSDGKWVWRRYWKLTDREHTDSFADTAEQVRYLVTDAICRQMVSDVPIGTFLSGGLDSSLICAVCARERKNRGEQLDTFSLDFKDNDRYFVPGKFQPNSDKSYIGTMQQWLNSRHHWTVLTPQEQIAVLQDATYARDLPGMADVDFSLLAFCKNIRSCVKVALSGECADEIFGGYPWYRDPEVRALEGFPWAQNTSLRAEFIHPQWKHKINAADFVSDHYQQTIDACDILPDTSPQEKRMKEMINLNHRWFMQTLLDRKDRMSMYQGLEVRVPFCDYRIAEYLYSVPWSFKDYQGYEKGLLRYAMRDYLPEEVLWRKKSPYPKTYDPQYMELVSDLLKQVIADKNAPILQIVSQKSLVEFLNSEQPWPWYGQLMKTPQTIAYMLQINYWLQLHHVHLV